MNICMCVNSKYVRYMYVALLSLFEHNTNNAIILYILQRDLTDKDKELIQKLCNRYKQQVCFIQIDESDFDGFPTTDKFPLEAYFRLEMIEKIPKAVDKILYIDVDVIINGSLSELYDINIEGYYFAAAMDMVIPSLNDERQRLFNRTDDLSYFNSGVMLINLMEMRRNVKFQDFIDAVYRLNYKVEYADQEILNYLYYNKVKYIDRFRWNYMVVVERNEDKELECEPIIYHYCGFNPWQIGPKSSKYSIWWEYAKKTAFYTEFLEEQLLKSEEYIRDDYRKNMPLSSEFELIKKWLSLSPNQEYQKFSIYKNKKIAIYGKGFYGDLLYKRMIQQGFSPDFIIDAYNGDDFYQLEEIRVDNLKNIDRNCIDYIIITPFKQSKEIKKTLDDIGVFKSICLNEIIMGDRDD